GELKNGASPASGMYDFKFTLYDALTGGTQLGPQLCSDNIAVTDGKVTVQLDFGAQFSGNQSFLEVWVRPDTGLSCGNNGGFSILGPRQSLTAAPNAIYSMNAGGAVNAAQLAGQLPAYYLDATHLSAGAIPDARLAGTYSGPLTFSN